MLKQATIHDLDQASSAINTKASLIAGFILPPWAMQFGSWFNGALPIFVEVWDALWQSQQVPTVAEFFAEGAKQNPINKP